MKTAVVTGATSFIGVPLIKLLLRKNYRVYAVVRPASPNMNRLPRHPFLTVVYTELQRYSELPTLIENNNGLFFHLAWDGIRMPERENFELQESNFQAALTALNAANALGSKVFIGAGSQAEYGSVNVCFGEEFPAQPITEYGKAKLRSCIEGMKIADNTGIRFIWPRIFSLYGPYDYPGSLIMSCIAKMRRHYSLDLTEATHMWDFLYVTDACEALLALGESEQTEGIYNVASGKAQPLKFFILELKEILRSQSDLYFGRIPYTSFNSVNLQPFIKRLMIDTEWFPKVGFSEGIKHILEVMKSGSENQHTYSYL